MIAESAVKSFSGSTSEIELAQNGRIARLRHRYQTSHAFISIERAKYYTESWKETEDKGLPLPVRVALAMKNVYEKMTHYLDPDERIMERTGLMS